MQNSNENRKRIRSNIFLTIGRTNEVKQELNSCYSSKIKAIVIYITIILIRDLAFLQ